MTTAQHRASLGQLPTGLWAAAGLFAGYGVAASTGHRGLGGVVLVVAGAFCARRWNAQRGRTVMLQLVGVFFAAFVLSHVLALAVGAWPSVAIVSAGTAAASWVLADRPARELQPV